MKKFMTLFLALSFMVAVAQERKGEGPKPEAAPKSGTIAVTPLDNTTLTPADMVESLLGPGITYSNVNFVGSFSGNQSGFFTNGLEAGLGIDEGVILSTGSVFNAVGPNTSTEISANLGLPGDSDLTALAGFPTYDANVLEFDFVPAEDAENIFIQFVFGSDEYPEYVGTQFNDVFAFFLNGVNIALVPGTNLPITVNTVNHINNSQYFKNNFTSPFPYNLEADGFTTVLTAQGPVNAGETNTIKLAIADGSDYILDSWVFLKGGGFTITEPEPDPDPEPTPVPLGNWAIFLGLGLIVVFSLLRLKRIL